ncbi:hypothetical protein ACS0TY_033580 [Phlomoides rotata]
MTVDPIEDEVPDLTDEGNDAGEPVDDYNMDGTSGTPRGNRGRKRAGTTSRRVWTYAKECELMNALNDLVVKGYKCDNGFRSGYLLLLENALVNKFPLCDLKAEPHINSKMHVMDLLET